MFAKIAIAVPHSSALFRPTSPIILLLTPEVIAGWHVAGSHRF
jgi:hypothetical protein